MPVTTRTRVAQQTGILQEAMEDVAKVHKELDSIFEDDIEKEIASEHLKYDLVCEDLASMMAQARSEIEACHQLPLKKRLLDEAAQKLHAFIQEQLDQSSPPDMQEMESASWITTTALMRIIEQRTKSAPTGHSLASPILQVGSSSGAMDMIPIRLDQCLVHPDVDRRPSSIPDDGAPGTSHSRGRARAPTPHLRGSLHR